jgi:RHH-type proline utilization regulon transcriptional repressor/proline dehydrogenase/delta 1-pyrroline-5-carboxylate dehydrogenase
MGGKNAMIIDSDADPDQAVPAVISSAFGFAGQKCSAASRVIVSDRIYDSFVARLVEATREVIVDHPRRMAARVGPVIDADSHERLTAAIAQAGREARILVRRDDVPTRGWFIGPTLVEVDDPAGASVARDELFGPVVAIMRAMDFDHAIAIANATDYALTAGIFSRSPAHIAQATSELRAGNLYINRAITGAVVGRQPFGGYGLSGVGSKAGGPDYLLQFLDPRTITENTVRQGFAAEE